MSGCPHLVSLQLILWRTSIQMTQDSVGESGIIFQLETFVNDWIHEIARDGSHAGRCNFGPILERMSSENNPGYHPSVTDLPLSVNSKKHFIDSTTVTQNQVPVVSHLFWERRAQVSTTYVSCDQDIQMERRKLPAWSVRMTFLDLIRENLVNYIC